MKEPAATQGIGELLIEFGKAVHSGDSSRIESVINQLSDQRYDLVTSEQRNWYQDIIKKNRLLHKDIRVKGSHRARSYQVLIQLAFEIPLTYQGYCQLEDCVEIAPGRPMHRPLLEAVHSIGITDFCVQLMVLKALNNEGLNALLGAQTPGVLIAAAGDQKLRLEHGKLVYEIAIGDLLQRAGRLDEEALREELKRQAYLASALQRIHPGRFETQAAELRQLLRLAYRDGLDRSAIQQILRSVRSAPTIASLAVVLSLANPEDAAWLDLAFTENLFAQTDTAGRSRRPWLDPVYDDGSDPSQDDGEQPSYGRPWLFPYRNRRG